MALLHFSFILICTVLITSSQTLAYPNASVQPATVAIFRFAVQSEMTDTADLPSQVCSQCASGANSSVSSPAPDKLTVDPQLLDAISNELQQALSKKKMTVMVDPDPNTIPIGSYIICGCIFDAQKGSATKRMVGMGWGASHLGAHIVFLSKTEEGLTPINSFDLQLKGRNLFPPGLSSAAFNAVVMERRNTLPGLAKKLANRIVKKLDSEVIQ